MREQLVDVIKHTTGLGLVDALRSINDGDTSRFEAVDNDRTVIVTVDLKNPIEEFVGTFGMRNLNILQGFLSHVQYKVDGAKTEVIKAEREGLELVESIDFYAEKQKKPSASYRTLNEKLLQTQPQLKVNKWDVSFVPNDSKVQEFASLASILSSNENFFTIKAADDNVEFVIGNPNSSNHFSSMVFAENTKGTINSNMLWPITQFLTLLKVGKNENLKIDIMNAGALKVSMENDIAVYSYILPGNKPQ
jgi:hypothetical protein